MGRFADILGDKDKTPLRVQPSLDISGIAKESVSPLKRVPEIYLDEVEEGMALMNSKGILPKALGALQYGFAPITAGVKGLVGEPVYKSARGVGIGETPARFIADLAEGTAYLAAPGRYAVSLLARRMAPGAKSLFKLSKEFKLGEKSIQKQLELFKGGKVAPETEILDKLSKEGLILGKEGTVLGDLSSLQDDLFTGLKFKKKGALVKRLEKKALKEIKVRSNIEDMVETVATDVVGEAFEAYPELAKKVGDLSKIVGEGKIPKKELGPITALLNGLFSPKNMAKVHPKTQALVGHSEVSFLSTEKRFTSIFLRSKHDAVRSVKSKDELAVMKLLDTYTNTDEIPSALRSQISPSILKAFTQIRNRIFDPIARIAKLGEPGKPGKISAYFTAIFDDISKLPQKKREGIIRNFAEKNGLDYLKASRILEKSIAKEGFFGPLSKSRIDDLAVEVTKEGAQRIWDLDFILDFYIKGAARKLRLDQFMPIAKKNLAEVDEGSKLWSVMKDYTESQRGVPVNMFDRLSSTIVGKLSRLEAYRQYMSKIAGNVGIAFFNLFQYPLNDGSLAIREALGKGKLHPLYDFAKGAVKTFTKRGRKLADRSGVPLDVGKGEVPITELRGAMQVAARIWGSLFTVSERFNKRAAYLHNHSKVARALDGVASLTKREKYVLGRHAGVVGTGRTQFFLGIEDRPQWLLNPIGATAGRFKTFTIKELEFIAGLDKVGLAVFIGMLDLIGGPRVIPGVRYLYFDLKDKHPDAKITKILDTMQDLSVTGAISAVSGEISERLTGDKEKWRLDIDLGHKIGIGFLPGVATDKPWWNDLVTNFWVTAGEFAAGPTVSDILSIVKDIRSGRFDNTDINWDWKDILSSRSTASVSVGLQRFGRALKEKDNKYVEFNRKLQGPRLLNEADVYLRMLGIPAASVEKQKQVIGHFDFQHRNAARAKVRIEDNLVELNTLLKDTPAWETLKRSKILKRLAKWEAEMDKHNREYNEKGFGIGVSSLLEAYKSPHMSYEDRVGRSLVQRAYLREQMEKHGVGGR